MSRERPGCWIIALLIVTLSGGLGWLILRAFSPDTGREVYRVLRSGGGYGRVEVILADNEYPPVRVDAVVRDSFGHQVAPEIRIGFADGRELEDRFGLYEAQSGSIVGLFRESRPNELLLIADFKAGVAFSFSTPHLPEQEASRLIVSLERENGRDFTLMDWLVVFGTSDGS